MKTIDIKDALKLVDQGTEVNSTERQNLQKERLRNLVDYVRINSPYFQDLYKNLPEDFNLTDLPVTEKAILLNNYDDWVTDRNLNKEKVLKYLDRDINDNTLLLEKYTALKTSGSTGSPLPMVRDDFHNKIHGALMSQRLLKGLDKDILHPTKNRIATVIHTSPGASSYNGYLRTKAAFPDHTDNMLAISILENIGSIVEKLNDFSPDVLTGYASSLVLLALEKKRGNLNIDVKLICNSAELLTDEAYNIIHEAFGCPVINNYCMTEGGEIAMANNGPELFLNEDWIIVEPVDKNKNPMMDDSEFSEGILVTDLSNFVQPIIRYYVSDKVKISSSEDGKILPKLKIDGRVFHPFKVGGKQYTIAFFTSKSEVWPGLLDIQIIQRDANILELRGVSKPGCNHEEILKGFAMQMQKYFMEDGCNEAKIVPSLEPMIHNNSGGKIPKYIDLNNNN